MFILQEHENFGNVSFNALTSLLNCIDPMTSSTCPNLASFSVKLEAVDIQLTVYTGLMESFIVGHAPLYPIILIQQTLLFGQAFLIVTQFFFLLYAAEVFVEQKSFTFLYQDGDTVVLME